MTETTNLVKSITKGIQEKKGQHIVIADLSHIDGAIANYFVILANFADTKFKPEHTLDLYKQIINGENYSDETLGGPRRDTLAGARVPVRLGFHVQVFGAPGHIRSKALARQRARRGSLC